MHLLLVDTIMRLTRYTDYALRVLIYLGLHPDRLGTIREIAAVYGISENHLMKIVQHLAASGYVESVRGRNGGLRLAHSPEVINIGQLVRDMEEDMILVECFESESNTCPISEVCVLQGALSCALQAFMDVLDTYTLDMLLRSKQKLNRALSNRVPD
jgi:Rrf2 family transcriptional regulator, nitric oxide-sensitive transcriptional repressor